MTGNQTIDYYVRPRRLYSHSRTCTRSGLCRRPSRWVASLICYLLDRASVHEISALVTCSSVCQTFPATMDILIYCIYSALWRSWSFVYLHHGDSDLCILYVAMTTYVLSNQCSDKRVQLLKSNYNPTNGCDIQCSVRRRHDSTAAKSNIISRPVFYVFFIFFGLFQIEKLEKE